MMLTADTYSHVSASLQARAVEGVGALHGSLAAYGAKDLTLTGHTEPTATGATLHLGTMLDYLSRVLAPAIGVTYFLGFLVVNFHLERYGISFLGLFAPQYIIAGLWALYPFLAGLAMSAAAQEPLRWDRHPVRWRRWGMNLLLTFALVFGFLSMLGGPLIFMILEDYPGHTWTAEGVIGAGAWVGAALFGLWLGQPQKSKPESPAQPSYRDYLFLWFIGLAVTVVYCRFFTVAYKTIPARWGGGREVGAKLFLAGDVANRIRTWSTYREDSTGLAAHLVLVTDDILLIVPPGKPGPAIMVKREDVDGIVLESRPRVIRRRKVQVDTGATVWH
jgi:hypothetical protein